MAVRPVTSQQYIRVSDLLFGGHRWREAVLYFLMGIWSADPLVTSKPEIDFGKFVLRWDMASDTFVAWRNDVHQLTHPAEDNGRDRVEVKCHGLAVREALVEFAKNDSIKFLAIYFPFEGVIALGKSESRGVLRTMSLNLPSREDLGTVYRSL